MTFTIDLHSHSTASDGSLPPAEVAALAKDAGLRAWALTDHDNVDGQAEAAAAAARLGVEYVPGLEISAEFPRPGSMHILGYYIDHTDPEFLTMLEELKQNRRNRNPRIVARLQELGLDITMEEVQAKAGGPGAQVGRPHFAAALIEKGHAATTQEAFDMYLARGRPGYAEKRRLTPRESIELIHRAGGLAVLAHPFTLGRDEVELRRLIRQMRGWGLDGLEVHYPRHTPEQTALYLALADEFELAITGGSDFHGAAKPDIRLGSGYNNNLSLDYGLVEGLKARLRQ